MAPHSRKLPQTKLVVCCCQLGVWLGSREQLYSAQVAAASCQPQVVAPPSPSPWSPWWCAVSTFPWCHLCHDHDLNHILKTNQMVSLPGSSISLFHTPICSACVLMPHLNCH